METQLAYPRRFGSVQWHALWPRLLAMVACVIVLHQLLMASPLSVPVTVTPVVAPPMKSALPCERTLPPVGVRACVNAEQLISPTIFIPLLAVLASFVGLVPVVRARSALRPAWRWPARRRRALLQVFLI